MNHFSIAFGTIIVGVVGAALVLDHVTSTPAKPSRAASAPSTMSAESTAPPSANVAVASSAEKVGTATTDDQEINRDAPSVSRQQETAPANAKRPSRDVASARSTRPSTQGSVSPAISPSDGATAASRSSPGDSRGTAGEAQGTASDAQGSASAQGPASESPSLPGVAATPAVNSTASDQSSSTQPAPSESSEPNTTK